MAEVDTTSPRVHINRMMLLVSGSRGFNCHLELRIFFLSSSLHTYHSIYYLLLREYLKRDCVMQLNRVFIHLT